MASSATESSTNNNLILSMATLVIIMAGIIVGVTRSKQKVQLVTQAVQEQELLTESDEIDDLQQELKYLQIDPVVEEMKVFENLN